MKLQIDILDPIPADIGFSYGQFQFAKFGVMCWIYDGYCGQVEWINTRKFVTTPKLNNPTAYRVWLRQGVIATAVPVIEVNGAIPDVKISGKLVNPLTGKNLPLLLEG